MSFRTVAAPRECARPLPESSNGRAGTRRSPVPGAEHPVREGGGLDSGSGGCPSPPPTAVRNDDKEIAGAMGHAEPLRVSFRTVAALLDHRCGVREARVVSPRSYRAAAVA